MDGLYINYYKSKMNSIIEESKTIHKETDDLKVVEAIVIIIIQIILILISYMVIK